TAKTSNDSSPIVCGGDFNIDALSTPSRDKIYKVMSPLTDIFTEETQPTIKLVYNQDGTEDSSVCLSCRQCESLVCSPNNRTIAKQRLDYVFWQQKSSKLKILQKKILPQTAKNFKHLSSGSTVYLILIIVCLLIIILLFRYSLARKVAYAKDKAKQYTGVLSPNFISY
ncbi:unnamed protein product, partial [marine sediment metagenome]